MRRMNLRDVPDDVYATLVEVASARRQSLSAYAVERLTEAARAARLTDYLDSYPPPTDTGVDIDDVVAAVHEGRATA